MPITGESANIMLNALLHTVNRFVGAAALAAATAVEASAAGTVIKKTNTLTNGNVLYFSVLSGGAGLVALRPYYVVGRTGSQFELARTAGGPAISFTTELKAASEYVVVTEISGGSYKRIETAFAAAAGGETKDTTEHGLKIPGGKTIGAEVYFEGESTGALLGISILATPEPFASEGTYTVKESEADLNNATGTPAP